MAAAVVMLVVRGPSNPSFESRDAWALVAGLGTYAATLAAWLRVTGERLRITGLQAEP